MLCNLTHLEEREIQEIKSMEQKLGKTILAYRCDAAKPAELNQNELDQLKELEQKTGLILVAVKA